MAPTTSLEDLPSDILYTIFPYLSAADFLSFTNSTKSFFPYRQDPNFWHALTRSTFRIPEQPLLQGARWQWLYKKLLTQTRLYTWGDNKSGNLGHQDPDQDVHLLTPRTAGRQFARPQTRAIRAGHSGLPKQPGFGEDIGIVADVQCGGWSTTILNSIGAIYMFGIFDGLRFSRRGRLGLRRLSFPPGYPATTKTRYEPSTAIKQFSSGRSSVLGLADDGKVWMWEQDVGFQVKLVHVDLGGNKVDRVIAGWDRNSMYVNEVGIVYWTSVQDSEIVRGGRQEALAVADTMLIDSVTIPGTGFYRKNNQRNSDDSLESRIGEVKSHIVLEGWIVFTTDLNKVFCYPTLFPMPAFDIPEPIELTTFPSACPSSSFQIRDLQGSFIRFAIFTNSGSVLTADKDILIAFRDASTSSRIDENRSALPSPTLIPSLQSGNVICLAFGDHHFHALQANGTIVSYGLEPQRCGALGLGNTTVSPLRGVLTEGLGFGGGRLLNDQGRTVWFEPKMQDWLHDMESKSHNGEANARGELIRSSHPSACEAMGKYFEREGAKWEDTVTKDGEMGAYFALKVSAAGWHSAALVLVDEDKAEAARNAHIVHPAAPTAPPSPALSAQSINSVDTQGFSYEIIDSPGEQLAHAVYAIYDWVWQMGRWFLGLQGRDERKKGEHERGHDRELAGGKNGKESEGIEPVYTWSNDPFPRLRMEGGEVMPGEIEVME